MGCGAALQQAAALVSPEESLRKEICLQKSQSVLVDEEHEEGVQEETVPPYWTNKKHIDISLFSQMVYASAEHHKTFGRLMMETYLPVSTKDRPCPKISEPCERQSQGCPCVRVGGDPGLPTGFLVRRVVRVENSSMWSRYAEKRKEIIAKRKEEKVIRFHPPIMTGQYVRDNDQVFGKVYGSINEVYLWHGTHVRTALSIAQQDFNMDLAGTGRGAMYGPGAYFAESCTKADEYAHDEPDGYYHTIRAILLCRVCMGKMHYTTKFGDEKAFENVQAGTHDSTQGDLAKHRKTFREFVVYNRDQVYPEYVVLYQRLHEGASIHQAPLRELAAMPFHLELPVYWRNCHRSLQDDAFDEQCRLRRTTCELLQQLVTACASAPVEVQAARRIENSRILNQYVSFKAKVRKYLQGDVAPPALSPSRECISVDKLPGNGQVLTSLFLREQGDFVEESISVDNLELRLNEHLLWYGASQDEVRAMSHNGLDVTRAGNNPEFSRFGPGLYFTERIDRSLTFAEPDDDGIKRVLLCRVCCGEVFYTEETALPNCDELAQRAGMHSVLANPSKSGLREYIAFENAQAYPEFILELKALHDTVRTLS